MSSSTSEVGESPPAYGTGNTEVNVSNSWTTGAAASGVAMVTCRVCQALIDISGKRDQHVVKCGQCHEATVSKSYISTCKALMLRFSCSPYEMLLQAKSM
jgi:Transmembrane protein 55A